uniref:Uncharacterized protein n=1 Tax=Eutreptiella gymnastica TaxID=73025 RepID=A0A6T2B9L7_9EUGL
MKGAVGSPCSLGLCRCEREEGGPCVPRQTSAVPVLPTWRRGCGAASGSRGTPPWRAPQWLPLECDGGQEHRRCLQTSCKSLNHGGHLPAWDQCSDPRMALLIH